MRPSDVAGYTQCHFFAGIAGWSYALRLAGWDDDAPVWTGSCPCQPLSVAGQRKGHADQRHLWPAFYKLISECRPATVFGEQVASKDGREWLAGVRADLESAGYAVGCADLCAAGVGAPHTRNRLYWVASDPERQGGPRLVPSGDISLARPRWMCSAPNLQSIANNPFVAADSWPQPLIRPLDDGLPARVDKLRCAGNAIVPQVAAEFIAAFIGCRP